jgi:hypothetical protein
MFKTTTFKTITMKKNITSYLLILSSFILFSCEKIDVNERPDFIGTWLTEGDPGGPFAISIHKDDTAIYTENDGPEIEGDIFFRDDKFKIGNKTFRIKTYPSIDTSLSDSTQIIWTMEISGPMFYLASGVYYRTEYNYKK